MPPLAALILDWALTALWPILGAVGMTHFSGVLFSQAGLVVGLVLLAPFLARGGRWKRLFARDTAPNMLAIGLFSGTATVIYINALAFTTPANAAIMAQVEVLYSALLCAYFLRERLSWAQGAGSLLVVAGTGLIMAHDLSSPRWKGDLMVLATPWMFQVSHIFSKRLPKDLDPVTISGGRIFYGLIALAPFCVWTLMNDPRWSWSREAMSILLLQGLLMSSLNFVLWYMAILRMDLAKATAIMLSYPALTVLFSWALGREQIFPVQLVGLAITLAGAYWVSRLVLAAERKAGAAPVMPVESQI